MGRSLPDIATGTVLVLLLALTSAQARPTPFKRQTKAVASTDAEDELSGGSSGGVVDTVKESICDDPNASSCTSMVGGVVVVGVAVIGLGIWWWVRRRNRKKAAKQENADKLVAALRKDTDAAKEEEQRIAAAKRLEKLKEEMAEEEQENSRRVALLLTSMQGGDKQKKQEEMDRLRMALGNG